MSVYKGRKGHNQAGLMHTIKYLHVCVCVLVNITVQNLFKIVNPWRFKIFKIFLTLNSYQHFIYKNIRPDNSD